MIKLSFYNHYTVIYLYSLPASNIMKRGTKIKECKARWDRITSVTASLKDRLRLSGNQKPWESIAGGTVIRGGLRR